MRISDWSSDVCSSDLIEFGEKLVLADVGRDHLTDLAVVEKRPETEAIRAAIVRDDREILDAACEQAGDQMLGIARNAEAARHDRHAVEKDAGKRRPGIRKYLALGHRSLYMSGNRTKDAILGFLKKRSEQHTSEL